MQAACICSFLWNTSSDVCFCPACSSGVLRCVLRCVTQWLFEFAAWPCDSANLASCRPPTSSLHPASLFSVRRKEQILKLNAGAGMWGLAEFVGDEGRSIFVALWPLAICVA